MTNCVEWVGSKNARGYGHKKSKEGKIIKVHREVFERHHGYLPPVVRHTCDNPSCINIEHLVGGTQKDNVRDCIERGRRADITGERNSNAVLTEPDVLDIRKRLSAGEKQTEIAKKYGIDARTVSHIKMRRRWGYLKDA